MISLEEMTDTAFDRFLDCRATVRAQSLAKNGLSIENATVEARRSLGALFPEGLATKGNLFRSIRDVVTGAVVGHIWLKPDYDDSLSTGALHAFTVYEGYRRKGFGSQAMSALMAYAHGQGMTSMRVWHAGGNDVGQAFCAHCGFKVVGSFMRKDVANDIPQHRIILEAMTFAGIKRFVDDQIQRQSARMVRDLGMSEQAALRAAAAEYDRFSGGTVPEGEHVLSIVDTETRTAVGVLWFGLHQEGPIQTAFIEDFYIKEEYRGNGLGGRALLALEQYAASRCAKGICLFVQAHNAGARRLYVKAGFAIGTTEMERSLIAGSEKANACDAADMRAQQTSAGDVASRAAPEK